MTLPEIRPQDEFEARCLFDTLDHAGDQFIDRVNAVERVLASITYAAVGFVVGYVGIHVLAAV